MRSTNRFQFDFEWQDPGGAKADELCATWASLSISIDDTPVTRLFDERTRSVRRETCLPLFPLAEWIADHWWFLQSETEKPEATGSTEFEHRHNLRWAREGFAVPSLRLVTLGDNIAVQWEPLNIQEASIHFPSRGSAELPASDVIEALREFVNAVISRLDEFDVSGTTLQEQWQAIEKADEEEQEFCRSAARLGVDPYAIGEEQEEALLKVAGIFRPELLNDFLSVATMGDLDKRAIELKSAAESISSDEDKRDVLKRLRDLAPPVAKAVHPWTMGYDFASRLRQSLNGSDWKSRTLDDLAGFLGVADLRHCVMPGSIEVRFIDALTGVNQKNNPKFIVKQGRPDSRQFAFCRALFEHLTSPPGRFAIISALRTDRQKMNRAFAAEFLAPHYLLKQDLSGTVVGEDEIRDLADEYGVSAFVIKHQIENHSLAQVTV